MKKKIICIIQARVGSSRFPGKILKKLNRKPSILRMIDRVKLSKNIEEIWIATGVSSENDQLEKVLKNSDVRVFRGDEDDVLSRFSCIQKKTNAKTIVRLTGDCPLIDPLIIDQVINLYIKERVDYASNTINRTFPDGLDVEVFSDKSLIEADKNAKEKFSREHVTTYIHGKYKKKYTKGNFRTKSLENDVDFSHLRWTLDEDKDFYFLEKIFQEVSYDASWQEIISFLTKKSLLQIKNNHIPLNQGSIDQDQKKFKRYKNSNNLFKRAIKTIPLASQTFSKSYIQWPKGACPLFIDRAHGGKVVDVDGNHYVDFVLGLLPITLGYCDPDVDEAVIKQISKGNTFSLPSVLEMELSEKLVKTIPSAEMVRFGKNGSDVTTAAIRIARAYTGKEMVAVSGYHGWHDWYISTTTRNLGVPKDIIKLTKKFEFNNLESLKNLFLSFPGKIGAVMLEPSGLIPTNKDFLQSVKHECIKNNCLLIFDEIISGFRVNLGGAQKEFGVTPDITCLGKGMANGYPLSAIVGKKEVMKLMEEIFFSATFGGESISLAASIATINKIEKKNVVNKTKSFGSKIIKKLNEISKKTGFADVVSVSDIDWWPQLIIKNSPIENSLFLSLFKQELLIRGVFLNSTFNLCYSHCNKEILNVTSNAFENALNSISRYISEPNPEKFLKGDYVSKTFQPRKS